MEGEARNKRAGKVALTVTSQEKPITHQDEIQEYQTGHRTQAEEKSDRERTVKILTAPANDPKLDTSRNLPNQKAKNQNHKR